MRRPLLIWMTWLLCMVPPLTRADVDTGTSMAPVCSALSPEAGEEVTIQGFVGLSSFRTQLNLVWKGSEDLQIRFKENNPSAMEENGNKKNLPPGMTFPPKVQVDPGRTLKPNVNEQFEVVVLNVTHEGIYKRDIQVLGEGQLLKHIKITVEALEPIGFNSKNPIELQATRCSACWLKDLLSLKESLGPRLFLLDPKESGLLPYIEQLKVDVSQEGGTARTPTVESLGWPVLKRQGSATYLALNVNPNYLTPGDYQADIRFVLPNGKMLETDKLKLSLEIRQGPGVVLGFALAGLGLALMVLAVRSRSSLRERLMRRVIGFLDESSEQSFTDPTIKAAYVGDVGWLRRARLTQSAEGPPSRLELVLVYRLAQRLRDLRQLQDALVRQQMPGDLEQLKQNSVQLVDSTCQALRAETEPLLIARSIEVLRMQMTFLEREALKANPERKPIELSFVVARLQIMESAARAGMRTMPVSWFSLGLREVVLSFFVAAVSLLGVFVLYGLTPTFGQSWWHYLGVVAATAGSMHGVWWLCSRQRAGLFPFNAATTTGTPTSGASSA